jgi:hypothetical protein
MTETTARRLDLKFKGSRTYLHGTDLFDAMVALIAPSGSGTLSDIRMSFYRPITHRVEAFPTRGGSASNLRPAALFESRLDGAPAVWELRELTGESVEGRRPYDEDQVAAGAIVQGTAIAQTRPTPYTFIERAVALNKRLLERLRTDSKSSWWFARLELAGLPPASPAIRLDVESELGGRLVRSSVEVDGRRTGSIYFSEKKA